MSFIQKALNFYTNGYEITEETYHKLKEYHEYAENGVELATKAVKLGGEVLEEMSPTDNTPLTLTGAEAVGKFTSKLNKAIQLGN